MLIHRCASLRLYQREGSLAPGRCQAACTFPLLPSLLTSTKHQQNQQTAKCAFAHRTARGTALRVMPNRPIVLKDTLDTIEMTIDSDDDVDCSECLDEETFAENYGSLDVVGIVRERTGWLALFAIGLLLAAGVVEEFDDLISTHVELSFFVPLIMGHGGNTGSQTTCAVIRALALKQVCWQNALIVVGKEAAAGCSMGAALGLSILLLALGTHAVSREVGLAVAVSLPVVSLWANGLGAFLTLASAKLNFDPALTSAPLVTTIVDTTGLVIYFVIASHFVAHDGFVAASLAVAS